LSLEEGDYEAVISSAFVIEQKLKDFLELRNTLSGYAREKPNFRLIHATFSSKKYYVIKEADWKLLQKIKRGEKGDWREKEHY